MRKLSVFFAGGCFGALANSLFVWLAGKYGLTAAAGVAVAPEFSPPWLYQRLVWGGLWGLLFLAPVLTRSIVRRGAVVSLGPSLVQLLIVFPVQAGKGMWGLELGQWTPAFVVVANLVWGVFAALWIKLAEEQSRGRDGL